MREAVEWCMNGGVMMMVVTVMMCGGAPLIPHISDCSPNITFPSASSYLRFTPLWNGLSKSGGKKKVEVKYKSNYH